MDGVQKAKSGHPGMPMGTAPMAYVLWTKHLHHNPAAPEWPGRDRFVLSAGHGSILLYSLLYLTGYGLTLDDLRSFRQLHSKTPGHPEYGLTAGVETTTGPLGQGFATGVGMAIAQRALAARYNRPEFSLFDYRIFSIVGDGDLMEGLSSEAASLAGHLKLGNLVYLYDNNGISIDGKTTISFTEDVEARFKAYGWHTVRVEDGNDLAAVDRAISAGIAETNRPSLLLVRTHIGFGSPNKQDTSEAHGSPLGEEEVRLTKKNLGWDPDKQFEVPEEVLKSFRANAAAGAGRYEQWKTLFESYRKAEPAFATELERLWSGKLPDGWKSVVPRFKDPLSTREASGKVLDALVPAIPTLIGGSADLTPSNNTRAKGMGDFQPETPAGRYLRFGVREHAMGAILNGITLTKGMIAYGGTFLTFSDYLRPAVRLAALMQIPTVFVFTHDSIGLGEDGPTHQPVEHLAALRCIPNVTVIRPSDANETAEAWKHTLEHTGGPVALILSRQKLPLIDRTKYAPADGLTRGAYILAQSSPDPKAILIATGSEVGLAMKAYETLAADGKTPVRFVAMPSWELFERQPQEYKDSVLSSNIRKRLVVEAGSPMGWDRYAGCEGEIMGISTFGASAPLEAVYPAFGFTVDAIVHRIRQLISR